jgi:hypothetical protein
MIVISIHAWYVHKSKYNDGRLSHDTAHDARTSGKYLSSEARGEEQQLDRGLSCWIICQQTGLCSRICPRASETRHGTMYSEIPGI